MEVSNSCAKNGFTCIRFFQGKEQKKFCMLGLCLIALQRKYELYGFASFFFFLIHPFQLNYLVAGVVKRPFVRSLQH